MALSGSGGAYYRRASTFSNVSPGLHTGWTMHFRVRASSVPSTANVRTLGALVGTTSQNPHEAFHWSHTAGTFYKAVQHRRSTGAYVTAQLTSSPSADTWYSWLGDFDGTVARSFLDGVLEATSAGSGTSSGNNCNLDLMALVTTAGALDASSQFDIGQIAEFALWDGGGYMTEADANSLAKGLRPNRVRPQNLICYVPCVREIRDIKEAVAFNRLAGSDVFTDHPRVYG